MKTIRSIFKLLRICLSTKEGKIGIIFFVGIFMLNIIGVKVSLELIKWNKIFYDSLESRDLLVALQQVGAFFILAGFQAFIALLSTVAGGMMSSNGFFVNLLQIRWRKVLTEFSLNRWFRNKAFWYLDTSEKTGLDNPDQRIAEDCNLFVRQFIMVTLDLSKKIIGLISYVVLLWNVADYALTFTLFERTFMIERYMVWIAPVYVAVSMIFTHALGKPLFKLTIQQQHKEADFRYALTRFRDSKEQIALQNGEKVERNILDERFSNVVHNWKRLNVRELVQGLFTKPYIYTIMRVPTFLALPAYFIGGATLGGMMQMSSAFGNVTQSLSWFIFSYKELITLGASSARLDAFLEKIDSFESLRAKTKQGNGALVIRDLKLSTESGKHLMNVPHAEIASGQTVLIQGRSGLGKSTLFRTIAGLHHDFDGDVVVPEGRKMFLSQKAYFPLGGMAHAVAYPNTLDEKDLPVIEEIISAVGFTNFDEKLLYHDMAKLSGGEQQRLIIARILFNKPEWVFLDESTNALDEESERFLMELMQERLPNSSFVIISHSDAINNYAKNYSVMNLNPVG